MGQRKIHKEKLSIPLETHDFRLSSEKFLSFRAKTLQSRNLFIIIIIILEKASCWEIIMITILTDSSTISRFFISSDVSALVRYSVACVNNQPLDSLETADRSEREQPQKTESSRSFDNSSPR